MLLPAVTLGTIWTFNNLNVIWLVSNGGEPQDSTHILVSYVYKAVFNLYRYGYGAALSMVMFVILLVFSLRVPQPHPSHRKRLRLDRLTTDTELPMREPKLITALRHAVLLAFVAISVYPALNVLSDFAAARQSACARPTCRSFPPIGRFAQLRRSSSPSSRSCAGSATRCSWPRVVTLTGVALASIGGYAFSRFRFVGRKATDAGDPHDADVPRHDAAACRSTS